MVQIHNKGPFDPKYIGDYCVVSIKGNQGEVRPSIGGPTEMKHVKHVKYVLPADQYIKTYSRLFYFWKKSYTENESKQIPDLHWQLVDTYHTTNIGQSTLHMSTTSVDIHTLSFAGGRKYNNPYKTTIDSNVDTIVCSISNKT